VATAESLTGGDVGGAICTVPGASAYYRGGVISYAYEVKAQVLGVDAQLLAREGAVHPAVAVQMAVGAARVCGADYAVLAVMGVVSFCLVWAGVSRIPEVMIIYAEHCIILYNSTVARLGSKNQAFLQYFLIFIVFFEYSYHEYAVFVRIFRILPDSYATAPLHRYTKCPKQFLQICKKCPPG